MASAEKPGMRYWSLVDDIWIPLNRSWDDGPDAFIHAFQSTRLEVGKLYAAHWCQSEVCNGGLLQFFSNTTGILAPEALAGFRAIGLEIWASILAEAMQFFGAPYPRNREERWQLLPSSNGRKRPDWDPFCNLDERFYEWLNAEPDRWATIADDYAARFIA